MHGSNDGHFFHFDRQTKLKLVQVISRRGHIADTTSTDRWMPIVIAWSKNGSFMISFNRKRKFPTALPEFHAELPSDNFSTPFGGVHESNLEQQRVDTERQNCGRNKASKILHKLFRPNNHKSVMAEPVAELSIANAHMEEKSEQPPYELDASGFSEIHELYQSPRELMGIPLYLEMDSNQQPLPGHYDFPACELDVPNTAVTQPAPALQKVPAPILPVDRPSSVMIRSSPRHQPTLKRGVSLTVDITSPNRPSLSQSQHHVQFTSIPSASTYSGSQSSGSAFFNRCFPQGLATPATPALSSGGDSGYHSATSPFCNPLLYQAVSPESRRPDHTAPAPHVVDPDFLTCPDHGCSMLDCTSCLDRLILECSESNTDNNNDNNNNNKSYNYNSKDQISPGPKVCPACGTTFSGNHHNAQRNLTRHRKSHCPQDAREKIPCRVKGCDSLFARTDGRNSHEERAHGRFSPRRRTLSGGFTSP